MKEKRLIYEYDNFPEISGAIIVKLFCYNQENAFTDSPINVYNTEEEAENIQMKFKDNFFII